MSMQYSEARIRAVAKEVAAEVANRGFSIIDSRIEAGGELIGVFTEIVRCLGIPREHTLGKADYLWRIQARNSAGTFPTFSEHAAEAELHTDSQYRANPEAYFGLCVERSARCGGGGSLLLDLKAAWPQVENEIGATNLKLLKESVFPFAVPSSFCEKPEDSACIVAPILSEGHIRYRRDTIIAGFQRRKDLWSEGKQEALDRFHDAITTSPHLIRRHLEDGAMLFVDNRRILHGRGAFADRSRLLWRIRFDSLET